MPILNSTLIAKAVKAATPWWQKGIIYQIYIRSFLDTNGDGVGDLPGVIAKLDYLKELGVDGIWLSPVNVTANSDWGYDVVDYYGIDPSLGTMADFDRLLSEAAKRDIKVLMDFVPNHTSIKHPWFLDAKTSRKSKYRDYYIWESPRNGRKPNNWRSSFGGSAWQYHKSTGQYYLHNWLSTQADLNWRNPEVRREFDKIMRFWLDRGVAGFRIDTFNMLIKDREFRNNPDSEEGDGLEVRLLGQRPVYNSSRPEIHSILKQWRKVADSYPDKKLLLGESTLLYDVRQLASFYGNSNQLELAFNLGFIHTEFKAEALRRIVEETEASIESPNWSVWTNSNHDQPRFPSRWAHGDERKIRCGMLMLLALRGTPVIYYGDEVGMQNTFVPPWRLKDPVGIHFWPIYSGRDRARTPMPWKAQKGAGFTENARPWLPYGELYYKNVEQQMRTKDSTWQFTRDLIALRAKTHDLNMGSYRTLPSVQNVWSWQRGKNTMVIINFSYHRELLSGIYGDILISTNRKHDGKKVKDTLHLGPWEGVVIHFTKGPPPKY